PMACKSSVEGMAPASLLVEAFTRTITRMRMSPPLWQPVQPVGGSALMRSGLLNLCTVAHGVLRHRGAAFLAAHAMPTDARLRRKIVEQQRSLHWRPMTPADLPEVLRVSQQVHPAYP